MKVDRLVSIVMLLLDQERVGARRLAALFEVSPRTIYRDMEAINLAGIPVRSAPGVGGGFEILPGCKLDKKVFSAADLSALLMGVSGLSQLVRGQELANALAKVRSLLPADRAKEIECKAGQVCIDPSLWLSDRDTRPRLEKIKAALQQNRLLLFEYTAHHGSRTARTVEPCQMVWKGGHWYLRGYCRKRNAFRWFRLSRISGLQMEAESFVPREVPQPALGSAEGLKALQTRVKLRIHRSVMDRVLDFCGEEYFLPDGEEHYIVSFPFIENEYYYDILFSFGDKCECLEPWAVRAEMGRRLRGMAALYES